MSSASARNTSNVAPPDKEPPFLRRPQAVPRKRRPGLVRFALAGALALLAAAGLVRFASSSRFALKSLRRISFPVSPRSPFVSERTPGSNA